MNGDFRHFEAPASAREGQQPAPETTDEVMVADVRAGLTPAQMVERKLVSLLKATPLPLSRLQTTSTRRSL
jgi:hypothetical protein